MTTSASGGPGRVPLHRRPLVVALAVGVWLAVAGYAAYRWKYAGPMETLREQIAAERREIDRLTEQVEQRRAVPKQLSDLAATTIGKEEDALKHRFSEGLSRIAERNALRRVVIDSRGPERVASPLKSRENKVETTLRRALPTHDFSVLRATLRAEGKLDGVLRALAEVGGQPWVHRIESFAIKPVGKDRESFALTVDAATLWMPDLLTNEPPAPALSASTAESEAKWTPVAHRNPFRTASPPAPPAQTQVVAAGPTPAPTPANPVLPPPPPPPYEQWQLTGLAIGASGGQAFLLNTRTGASLTVLMGGVVEDAKLIGVSAEHAVFEIGGQQFEVRLEQTLAQRTPAAG